MTNVDPGWTLALIDAGVWASWSALAGYIGSRWPRQRLARDTWITRPRTWERDGRFWTRVGVRRWKDRLPDAGSLFGGDSKRTLPGRTRPALERFAAETRRAEYVHWGVLGAAPCFALWNPPGLTAAMVAYGVVANVPCIIVQRSNRGRILRALHRMSASRS